MRYSYTRLPWTHFVDQKAAAKAEKSKAKAAKKAKVSSKNSKKKD
jgi:hypothetical protein